MREPLIPDDVRKLYEELIGEGSRLLTDDDPRSNDPALSAFLTNGFGTIAQFEPQIVMPARPDAVFAYVLQKWQERIELYPSRYGKTLEVAARMHRASIAANSVREKPRSCDLVSRRDQVMAIRHVLSSSGSSRLRTWNTGPYGQPRLLPSGEPHPLKSLYFAPRPEFIRRGGRLQVLTDAETFPIVRQAMIDGYNAGEEIRMVDRKLPLKLLIVDDHTALLPLGPYGSPCLLVRDPCVVRLLVTFYDIVWETGVPWVPDGITQPHKDTTLRRRIIEGLASGCKDEAIARQLGMSARTVRRHVAELMQELGATTRFAAGVAAFRQGLVDEVPQQKVSATRFQGRPGASRRVADA